MIIPSYIVADSTFVLDIHNVDFANSDVYKGITSIVSYSSPGTTTIFIDISSYVGVYRDDVSTSLVVVIDKSYPI